MSSQHKRFRIEGSATGAGFRRPAAVVGTETLSVSVARDNQRPDPDRLAQDLAAMRAAIRTKTYELGELQRSPAASDGIRRAASELEAVSAATERATTTILSAVEEIEMAANLIRFAPPGANPDQAVATILDGVLALYETCNFQDITGQRIRKVVGTWRRVDEKLDLVIEAWQSVPTSSLLAARPESFGAVAMPPAGPALPGDAGHVSQVEVDALFA